MEKFKLADFKVSSIRIDDMLNVMGGSGGHTHNDTGTCGCLTCTTVNSSRIITSATTTNG